MKAVPQNGKVVIEFGPGLKKLSPDVRNALLQSHTQTAVELQKYQGLTGKIRGLIEHIRFLITGNGAGKYGTEDFVAKKEIEKLNDLKKRLLEMQQAIENDLAGMEAGAKDVQLNELQSLIKAYEEQLAGHVQKLGSMKIASDQAVYSQNTQKPGSSASNPLQQGDKDFHKEAAIGETRYYEDAGGKVSRTTRLSEHVFELEASLHPDRGVRADYQSYKSDKGLGDPNMQLAHALGPIVGTESPQGIFNAAEVVNQNMQRVVFEGHIKDLRKNMAADAEMRLVVRVERVQQNGKDYLKFAHYQVFASKPGKPEVGIMDVRIAITDPFNPKPAPGDFEIESRTVNHPDPFLADKSHQTKPAKSKPYKPNPKGPHDTIDPQKAREYIAHVYLLQDKLMAMTQDPKVSASKKSYAALFSKFITEGLNGIAKGGKEKQIQKLTRDRILNMNDMINDQIFWNLPELKQLHNFAAIFSDARIAELFQDNEPVIVK
ncbi:MAG: hypothetical protein R3B47_20525 [Bacteroidia bacterium]